MYQYRKFKADIRPCQISALKIRIIVKKYYKIVKILDNLSFCRFSNLTDLTSLSNDG